MSTIARTFLLVAILALIIGAERAPAQSIPQTEVPTSASVNWKQDAALCKTAKDPKVAVRACSSAIDSGKLSNEGLADAYYSRAEAYLLNYPEEEIAVSRDVEGKVTIDLGSIDPRAIKDFSRVIELRPNDVRALIGRARAYRAMDDLDQAIGDWGQVIRLNPSDPGAYYARGLAYQDNGALDDAMKDFSEIIRLSPGDPNAFFYRGKIYLAENQYDSAIQDFNQTLRLDPKHADAFFNRGGAYIRKGEYDRAIQDLTQAIRLSPEYDWAFADRGDAYFEKGDYDRAISDYTKAIKLNPTYKKFYHRGRAYNSNGQYDLAIQDYNEAIRLNPRDAEALRGRGFVWAGKGEYSSAMADFTVAIRLNPDDVNSYFSRGIIRFALGEFAAAQEDLHKGSSYPYGAIWLYLARARAGQEARSGLAKDSEKMRLDEWPGPVISLYLGTMTPQAVLDASKNADPKIERGQRCEAVFYVGQYALLAGKKDEAMRLFREAVAMRVYGFVELIGAQAELRRQ